VVAALFVGLDDLPALTRLARLAAVGLADRAGALQTGVTSFTAARANQTGDVERQVVGVVFDRALVNDRVDPRLVRGTGGADLVQRALRELGLATGAAADQREADLPAFVAEVVA